MSMKEAFDTFFEKNNNSWKKQCLPTIPNCEKYANCPLTTSTVNGEKDLEWQPKLQTEHDKESLWKL